MSSRTGRTSPVSRKGSNIASTEVASKSGDADVGVKSSSMPNTAASNNTFAKSASDGAAESQSRGICVTSDEINFLVYRYLQESGEYKAVQLYTVTSS